MTHTTLPPGEALPPLYLASASPRRRVRGGHRRRGVRPPGGRRRGRSGAPRTAASGRGRIGHERRGRASGVVDEKSILPGLGRTFNIAGDPVASFFSLAFALAREGVLPRPTEPVLFDKSVIIVFDQSELL